MCEMFGQEIDIHPTGPVAISLPRNMPLLKSVQEQEQVRTTACLEAPSTSHFLR